MSAAATLLVGLCLPSDNIVQRVDIIRLLVVVVVCNLDIAQSDDKKVTITSILAHDSLSHHSQLH